MYGSLTYGSAGTFDFPCEMRATPTCVLYGTTNANTTGTNVKQTALMAAGLALLVLVLIPYSF